MMSPASPNESLCAAAGRDDIGALRSALAQGADKLDAALDRLLDEIG